MTARRSRPLPTRRNSLRAVLATVALLHGVACGRQEPRAGDTTREPRTVGITVDRVMVRGPSEGERPRLSDDSIEYLYGVDLKFRGVDTSELKVILAPVQDGNTPADLLVIEPRGIRRTGVAPTSFVTLREIPRAHYDSAPPTDLTEDSRAPASLPREFWLQQPWIGTWTIAVVGRREGPYTLEVRVVPRTGVLRRVHLTGLRTAAGAVQRFAFDYTHADTGAVLLRRLP
jgi:hypothetical protein